MHDDGAGDAAVGNADTDGAKFGEIVLVLVSGQKVLCTEERADGSWDLVGCDEVQEGGEGGDVGVCDGVIVGGGGVMEGVGLEYVNAVGKGARGSASALAAEGSTDVVGAEGNGRWGVCGGGRTCGGTGVAWEVVAGWVEGGDGLGDEERVELGNWEGGLHLLVGGAKVVEVCEPLCNDVGNVGREDVG